MTKLTKDIAGLVARPDRLEGRKARVAAYVAGHNRDRADQEERDALVGAWIKNAVKASKKGKKK